MIDFKSLVKIQGIVLIVCIGYRLSIICTIISLFGAGVFYVGYMSEEKKRITYLNRYREIIMYMEQLIYSLKKQPKIRQALSDAQKISSLKMKEIIEETIVNIDTTENENIYEESLQIIQNEYDCKRLKSLHDFIIKIEMNGGKYQRHIDTMLEDIKEWSEQIQLFIKDVERVKRNVLISVFSTLITCGMMVYLVPKDYRYAGHIAYQICTCLMIIFMLAIYFIIMKKLNIDWIGDNETLDDNLVVKYYILVEKGSKNRRKLSFWERVSYKSAKKRLEKEIAKAFPDWIRELAINVQNDTVQSAIERTYDNAPFILRRPIRKLLIDFEKYPVGIEPYDNFLKELELEDIKSSIKMFYSVNELGREQSDQQIGTIIERNNKLSRRAQELKNKDKVGAAGMFCALPMLAGVIKIMIDMILMIIVFTSSISNIMAG